MADKIKIRRGLFDDLPNLDEGELGLAKDRGSVYIGTSTDDNILLNPVKVNSDGYSLDGYLYPAVDNVHGLGTPDKRWHSVSVGPGSLHIISKSTDVGYTNNNEYVIGVDPSTNKLQIASGTSVLIELDPDTGASFPAGGTIEVDNPTEQEHYNQQQQTNQTILQALDGYASDFTVTEHYQQLSTAIDLLRQAADAYGAGGTEQEHYAQQSQINNTILQSLDGYALRTTEDQRWIDSSQQLQDIRDAADAYGITLNDFHQAQDQFNQTLIQALDGYASDFTVTEHYQQLSTAIDLLRQAADAYGTGTTEQEHYVQQAEINATIIQALDGYAVVPDISAVGDGYLAFFIDGGRQIAGDNDLYWDRENNRLGIGTLDPTAALSIFTEGQTGILIDKSAGTVGGSGITIRDQNTSHIVIERTLATTATWSMSINTSGSFFVRDLVTGGNPFPITVEQAAPTNSFYISSAGNIGLGTNTPQSKLDVEGGVAIGTTYSGTSAAPTNGLIVEGKIGAGIASVSANTNVDFTMSNTSTTTAGLEIAQDSTGDSFMRFALGTTRGWALGIDNSDSDSFKLGTAANVTSGVDTATFITITTGGNIGLGTDTPQNNLDIDGAVVVGLTYAGTNTAPSNGMLIEGAVGIGTASPDTANTKVEIQQTLSSTTTSSLFLENTSTGDVMLTLGLTSARYYSWGIDNSDEDRLKLSSASSLGVGVDTDTIMTVSGNSSIVSFQGNVGIGTLLPFEALTINGIIALQEQDSVPDNTIDGYGKIWVDTSGELNFVDDNGNNVLITTGGVVNAVGTGVEKTSGFTGSDGYISFWTGSNEIAGDNDLFFDRVNNWLGVGTAIPTNTLTLKGSNASLDITIDADAEIGAVRFRDNLGTGQGGLFYEDTGNYLGLARSISSVTANGLFIDSFGKVGVGINSPSGRLNSTDDVGNINFIIDGYGNDSSVEMQFRRAGGIGSAPSDVLINSDLGRIVYRGYFGGTYYDSSSIIAEVDSTPGAGDMPGRLIFSTTPDSSSTVVERMRISNSGRVTIGGDGIVNGEAIKLQIISTGTGSIANTTLDQISTGGNDSIHIRKSRGSLSSRTIVASQDYLGSISFMGYDGTFYRKAASIDAYVDGTPGAGGNMPGVLSFTTFANGSDAPQERMRITNSGRIGIGTADPQEELHVFGDGYFDGSIAIGGQFYYISLPAQAPTGTTVTLDFNTGAVQVIDLNDASGNVTVTFNNLKLGGSYIIKVIQDVSTPRNIVWPASVKWQFGTAPTISTASLAVDIVSGVYDGTNFYANIGQEYA